MLSPTFAEDILLHFYTLVSTTGIIVHHQDFSPIYSFYSAISSGTELTKNQANYITKLLEKYKHESAIAGFDYRDQLANLQWRTEFRQLDLSKKIYVEENEGKLEICLRFPYQLKKDFEVEIDTAQSSGHRSSSWDSEHKVRRLNFYEFNLISLYEFAIKHNFEIDDSFMNAVSQVEEIWQNAETIVPYCELTANGVELFNAPPDAQEYFLQHKQSSFSRNLMLAKSMGFLYKGKNTGIIERIASSPDNTFWIKEYKQFFGMYNELKQQVCILLDRSSNTLQWLQNFVAEADRMGVGRDQIKVCFREGKDSKGGINEWVKLAGVGGKVETGKILIFETKPAKWLFKQEQDVTLLVTNNIYPPTNITAQHWFNSHPCVIYLGDTRPTKQKGQNIVEL